MVLVISVVYLALTYMAQAAVAPELLVVMRAHKTKVVMEDNTIFLVLKSIMPVAAVVVTTAQLQLHKALAVKVVVVLAVMGQQQCLDKMDKQTVAVAVAAEVRILAVLVMLVQAVLVSLSLNTK